MMNQYRVSPSGPVMTCWMRAFIDPAADFICSLLCRMFLTSSAHSLERNLTATVPPSVSSEPAQYIRAFRPLTLGQRLLPHPERDGLSESEGGARTCTNSQR